MKELILASGERAQVDDEDYPFLKRIGWALHPEPHTNYAQGLVVGKLTYLHRLIMNPAPKQDVDHIDGNGLNNQKSNLRICTRNQNLARRSFPSSTGYRGVSRVGDRYKATGQINGKRTYLGTFDTPEEAAEAYDRAALAEYGDFATVNAPLAHERESA